MSKNVTLRPVDIPVALRLAERPDSTYEALSKDLGISTSTAHEALQRLALAGLIHPHRRRVNRSALIEFIEHGVRYAFPARPGQGVVTGVPTAHVAPVLASEIIAADPVVWPDPEGTVEGEAVEPLYDKAIELPRRCPSVYEMLTLVDALRVGRARERRIAMAKLRERLGRPDARRAA